jgi:hypothetical protein
MTKKVCKFYEVLGKHTQFDRGDEKFHAYVLSNLLRKRVAYPRFVDQFKTLWEEYMKNQIGFNLSQLFIDNGNTFLKDWYTEVFPFPKRIEFEFRRGGSQVDVLITIKYTLSEIEITCFKDIIKSNNIQNKTPTAAGLISLLEPCVLLGEELSKIIGQEIRVSIEDRTIENNDIVLELSVRPK